jgi:hypothetical protein
VKSQGCRRPGHRICEEALEEVWILPFGNLQGRTVLHCVHDLYSRETSLKIVVQSS